MRIFEQKANVAPLVAQVTISGKILTITMFGLKNLLCAIYNYLGTGFCSREIVSATGTTFDWSETKGGTNASYLCPNNATVTRRCEVGGQWQDFDRIGCAPSQ